MKFRRRALIAVLAASATLSVTAAAGTGYVLYHQWQSDLDDNQGTGDGLRGVDYVVDERLQTVENNYTKLTSELDHGSYARNKDLADTNRKVDEALQRLEETEALADKANRRILDMCIINRIC